MSAKQSVRDVKYGSASLRDFHVEEVSNEGVVTLMSVDGKDGQVLAKPTQRFWTSLCSNLSSHGLTTKLFKLFTHQEVFERVYERLGGNGGDRFRFAVEDLGLGYGNLLAVSNPQKALVEYQSIGQTLENYAAIGQEYGGGIVRSTHSPNHMHDFKIGGDTFVHQYVMETPVDGFGNPLIYLSLLRMVCSNGAIGYARAFRSEIQLGRGDESPIFTLERALDSFSNEEGYMALRQRFESSQKSWASIAECHKVYRTLQKMCDRGMFKQPASYRGRIDDLALARGRALGGMTMTPESEQTPTNIKLLRAYSQLTGDLVSIYGLTSLDALSIKKQGQLPGKCTMYDLMNFCTEVATHYTDEKNGRLLQAEIGNFVSNEFDLENTIESKPDFDDWFVEGTGSIPGVGENPENN